MADDRSRDQMGYAAMEQEASRGVVKAALKRAAQPGGLPGDHHLYVTFKTHAHGVSVPPDLIPRYPEEMTIVLQHQFWDLAPGETFFAVTLKFGGSPKRLSVPYTAVTRFYDPSVQYLLQFDAPGAAVEPTHEVVPLRPRPTEVPHAQAPRGSDALEPETEPEAGRGSEPAPATPAAESPLQPEAEPAAAKGENAPKIVSLDQFRKK